MLAALTDVATLASGGVSTGDEINTILAAGRADLCLLDRRRTSAP